MGMGKDVHCGVDLVDGQIAMNILHGLASRLHGVQGLLVDVGRFDAVDLCFDLGNLVACLL
jgi:hypothetical protein